MFETVKEWLTLNGPWLGAAASVVTILTVIELIFKPIRRAISKVPSLWERLREKRTSHFPLRFVAMDFPNTYWGIGKIGDQPIACIVIKWHATREPGSPNEMEARLLKVHLLQPSPKSLIHSDVITTSGEYANTRLENAIPEGKTRKVIVRCNLTKIPNPKRPIKVRLVLEDQLENKHVLRPVTVLPMPAVDAKN
jgi:hypothetical protein